MMHVDVTVEDTRIIGYFQGDNPETPWNLDIYDGPSGVHTYREVSHNQLAAIVALAVGDFAAREQDKPLSDLLYEIAEPVCEDMPPECRPIP